jgi:ABC-type amino acid transport substrate-binding protein
VGYSIFGNLAEENPSADLIKAVEDKQVDVAVAWGPLAGYFARHSAVPLDIVPVASDPEHPELPFSFDIAIGVRKGDTALKQRLDAELVRRHAEIEQTLRSYGIPQVNLPARAAVSTGE